MQHLLLFKPPWAPSLPISRPSVLAVMGTGTLEVEAPLCSWYEGPLQTPSSAASSPDHKIFLCPSVSPFSKKLEGCLPTQTPASAGVMLRKVFSDRRMAQTGASPCSLGWPPSVHEAVNVGSPPDMAPLLGMLLAVGWARAESGLGVSWAWAGQQGEAESSGTCSVCWSAALNLLRNDVFKAYSFTGFVNCTSFVE